MKKQAKSRPKVNIANMVCGMVTSRRMLGMEGKDAAQVLVPQIKKKFPGSKFKLDHVYWYLGQLRWQKKHGLPTTHLVSRHSKGGK